MSSNLASTMKEQAYFVAGRHPWDREKSDPLAKSSLQDARRFLHGLKIDIGQPLISGGTTANPQIILTFAWFLPNTDASAGIYINFYGNNRCDLISVSPLYEEQISAGLTVDQVIAFDIPDIYLKMVKSLKASDPDRRTMT